MPGSPAPAYRVPTTIPPWLLKRRYEEENHKFRPPPPPVDNNDATMDISHASNKTDSELEPSPVAHDGHRPPAPIDTAVGPPAFPAPGTDGKTELDFVPIPPDFEQLRIHLPALRTPEADNSSRTQAEWARARTDKPHSLHHTILYVQSLKTRRAPQQPYYRLASKLHELA